MTRRISKIARSLKQLGDIQVNEWDFMALLHKDINDLDVSRTLRRVGQIRVLEWDFREALPAVSKLANKEVDIVGIVKRTASYKVLEWDFRPKPLASEDRATDVPPPQPLAARLEKFLRYVVDQLVDEPERAHIVAVQISQDTLRLELTVTRRDEAMLIGRGGETASAIRGLLKAAGRHEGFHVLLAILNHEKIARGR